MGWNYTDFTDFYDCEGTGALIGEKGLNFSEDGPVAENAGKFGDARGPDYSTSDHFSRVGTGGWDTRVAQGFTKGSFIAWFRTTSNTATQTTLKLGATATSNQALLRTPWPGVGITGDDDPVILLIYDWALNNGTFQVGGAVRISQGAFPTSTWCMVGVSVNVTSAKARLFLGVSGEGTYFDERSMAGWNAFQSTNASTAVIGCGFNAATPVEPMIGLIDHVTWTNGRFYELGDFNNHWNGGSGLPRANYVQGNPGARQILAAKTIKARGHR